MMSRLKHRAQNGDNIGLFCEFLNAEQSLELLKGNCDGSSTHKPDNGGVREKFNQEPQSENEAQLVNILMPITSTRILRYKNYIVGSVSINLSFWN